jgi:hypothetical protein
MSFIMADQITAQITALGRPGVFVNSRRMHNDACADEARRYIEVGDIS